MNKRSQGTAIPHDPANPQDVLGPRPQARPALDSLRALARRSRATTATQIVGRLPDSRLRNTLLRFVVAHRGKAVVIPPTNQRLRSLRNRYIDERCFIVGTGPSLATMNLSVLKCEFVFTVNRGYLLRDALGKWPDAYLMSDARAFGDYGRQVPFRHFPLVFLETSLPREAATDRRLHVFRAWERPRMYEGFCETNITRPLYGAHTSVLLCTQIAAYMGFKRIYFLGVDLAFENGSNHFYQSSVGEELRSEEHSAPLAERMLSGFAVARDVLERRRQVKMFNAGKGGRLSVLPRVRFEEIL